MPALPIPVAEDAPSVHASADQTEVVVAPTTIGSGAEPAPESLAQQPAVRPAADELPDWLRDLHAFQQEPPQPRPLPAATGSAVPEPPTEAVARTEHDLPAWLRADMEDVATPEPAPASAEDVSALPAWLANGSTAADAAPPSTPPNETPTEPARPGDAGRTSATSDVGIPSWLIESPSAMQGPTADATSSAAADAAPSVQRAPTETSMSSLPRWLLDDDEDDDLPPVATPGTDADAMAVQRDEDILPAWLRDTQPTPINDDAAPSWAQSEALRHDQPVERTTGGEDQVEGARTYDFPTTTEAASTPQLPDWLLDTDSTPQPRSEAPAPQGPDWLNGSPSDNDDSALPSWLAGSTSPTNTAGASAADLPSWLVDPPAQAATAPSAVPGEQPDWLSLLGSSDVPTAADGQNAPNRSRLDAPSPHEDSVVPSSATMDARQPAEMADARPAAEPKLPDWLLPTPEEAAQAAQPGPAEPEDDVPEWLRDFTTNPQPRVDQEAEPRPIDQWLTDTGPEPPSFAALPIPVSDESRARIYDVRDEEVEVAAAAPREESPALPSWLVGKNTQTGEEPWALPPWLSEADSAEDQATLAAARNNPATTRSDVPSWLQVDEEPATAVAVPQTSAVPSWLEGDTVPAPPQRVTEQIPVQRQIETPPTPTEERMAASTMLRRMVAEPEPEPVAVAMAPRARRSSNWLGTILGLIAFLLIVGAILYVLFGPGLPNIFGSLASKDVASATPVFQQRQVVTPGVAQWQQQLEQLEPQAPVLIAYATDGSRGAELGALEEGLIEQLQSRSAPLALMATDPQGALLSRQRAAAGNGTTMVDLGYKPGGVVALARVAHNFGGLFAQSADGRDLRSDNATLRAFCGDADATAARCTLERVGMVVVLADEPGDVRAWIEQVGSAYPRLPLVVAVPAETAPHVRPYLVGSNTMMLAGLADARALGEPEGNRTAVLGRQSDAVAVGGAVWGIVALVGAVPALLGGWLRRRKGQNDLWQR